MKRFILVIIIFVFSLANVISGYALPYSNRENVNILVNGEKVKTEQLAVWANSRLLVPARSVFQRLGAKVEWYPQSSLVVVSKENTSIKMKIGNRKVTVSNKTVKMDEAPVLLNGTVMVPIRFVAENLKAKVNWDGKSRSIQVVDKNKTVSASRGNNERTFVVIVDAGHGGKETGAIHGGIEEKDLNLSIAMELNKLLVQAGIKTYMTRTGDTYKGLYERSDLANNVNADLLISVHNNADAYSGTKGSMSLYYPYGGNSKGNLTAKEFASIVQKALTGDLSTNNLGIIARPHLAVLRTAKMPAVIAEVGYMTNRSELARLKSSSFEKDAANALKNAVLEALNKI